MNLVTLVVMLKTGGSMTLFSTEEHARATVDNWRRGLMKDFHTLICTQHGSEITFRPSEVGAMMWERRAAELPQNQRPWNPAQFSRS